MGLIFSFIVAYIRAEVSGFIRLVQESYMQVCLSRMIAGFMNGGNKVYNIRYFVSQN